MIKISKIKLKPLQILALGFIAVILTGALLLMLPISNKDGGTIPFINALVQATSATCVTGLTVYDPYTQFTFFGQLIILALIQVGGLGFMMFALMISLVMKKRIGLRERTLMQESLGAPQLGGIVRLTKTALYGTIIIEGAGALLLMTRFIPKFGFGTGLWFSIFHSISSFCNAGFDLMGKLKPLSSLVLFQDDIVVNITVMALIVMGGIGFIVWTDAIHNKWHFKRYMLHSKIVLIVTAFLIIAGALSFWILEDNHAFAGMSFKEKLLASLFQSVTPRTAGYATVDQATLSEGGLFLTMFLMLVGGSPGSTGGGIKTTTFFVMVYSLVVYFRGSESIGIFRRRIEDAAIKRAFNSTMAYISAAFIGTMIISSQGYSVDTALYEALSAIGTVGLTVGITPGLPTLSKLVISFLMYIGRVGSLAVLMAVAERKIKTKISNVEEKIILG